MNIEYSKKKQELRQDPILDSMVEAKEFVKKNARQITIALVSVVVVVAGVLAFTQVRAAAAAKADEAFGKALATYQGGDLQKAVTELGDVANEFKGTPQASYAAYVLGTALVGEERFDEAIEWFTVASKGGTSSGFVPAAAVEGLSIAHEGKGDVAKAIELGRKALADSRLAYRHSQIRWRLALLSRQQNDGGSARKLCSEIVSDTSATLYHQRAKNLLAELAVGGQG